MSELKINTIIPTLFTTSSIQMGDGEVTINPTLKVDTIEPATPGGSVTVEGFDSSVFVTITDNQNVGGIKTFTSIPVLPASNTTTDNQAVRKAYVDTSIVDLLPPGCIHAYAGSTAPTGYLLCDGSLVSTTTYSTLFAIIGYTYGGGGGNFALPNLKGKIAVGYNAADSDFNVLGKTGGDKEVTLTIDEMPSHHHSLNMDTLPWSVLYGTGSFRPGTTLNTESTGGSQPHQNLQPYITLNFIIKY